LAKDGHVARFIEPMECLPVDKIPEGDVWTYEIKLDGYRMVAVKAGGKVTLYSRRGTNLSQRFRYITSALNSLPDNDQIWPRCLSRRLESFNFQNCENRIPASVEDAYLILKPFQLDPQ